MKKLFLFAVVVSSCACLQAQQTAPTATATPPPVLPPGPIWKPVADNMRWTLIATTKHSEAASPGASPGQASETGKPGEKEKAKDPPTTTVGERMGKAGHLLTIKASGGREERWTDGTLLAIMHVGAKAPVFTTERIERMPTPAWVSRENFTDVKTQGDKTYFIFKARIMPSGVEIVRDMEAEAQGHALDTESLKVEALAVVDADTRLPVVVKEGETSTTYKFESLPPDTQIIPAAIQASLAEHEKQMRELVRKPVHP